MASEPKGHQEARVFVGQLVIFWSVIHNPCAIDLRGKIPIEKFTSLKSPKISRKQRRILYSGMLPEIFRE